MIPDHEANTLYIASIIKEEYTEKYETLKDIVEKAGYTVKVLEGTRRDMFCNDYMPVQVSKEIFMEFVYQYKTSIHRSDINHIYLSLDIRHLNQLQDPFITHIRLNIENLVKWEDKVIISDCVVKDNEMYYKSKKEVINALEEHLKCKVILIPEYPAATIDRADSLIRFIDGSRVFINETARESETKWVDTFLSILDKNKLTPIALPRPWKLGYASSDDLYMNYLHLGKLIIVPQFKTNKKKNIRTLRILQDTFDTSYTIVPFDVEWISRWGHVFNGAFWCVLE